MMGGHRQPVAEPGACARAFAAAEGVCAAASYPSQKAPPGIGHRGQSKGKSGKQNMPRVVPSQIVTLIDDFLRDNPDHLGLSAPHAPFLDAVVQLTSEIPEDLLSLSGEIYNRYIVAINTIKRIMLIWMRSTPGPIGADQRLRPALVEIRETLARCPDEAPSPATAELSFIPDADLRDSIRNDISAANRALHDGLWKASTVLAGAAAEALLRWAITEKKSSSDIETARAAIIPHARRDPNDWVLDGYIKVARELALIEDETETQADLAREFRNLIHPGRSTRLAKICDRGTALSALAAVEFIVRDLS
jgi:hypothetical protein